MRKISDTIARLAAFQARHGTSPNPVSDRLSSLIDFGSNPGALKASLYVPAGLPEGAPLVVVLHGCTQSAAGYDHHSGWSQLADEAGFALLYPEQQRSNNQNLCFNWFQPTDVQRGSGEALSIRQMIDATVKAHRLDRKRIFVTGLSAGGAMSAAMLATYPDVFAGGAIIAGLAYGSATTIPEAFDRMRGHGGPSHEDLRRMLRDASVHRGPWPRISIWQGTADQTVVASNADAIASQWRGVHKIDREPTHSRTDGRNARHIWCDADGESVLEINMIAGMGHGTPIDKRRLGAPGPYMLDVGVPSTLEIARFWGIADAAETDVRRPRPDASSKAPSSKVSPPKMATKSTARLPANVVSRSTAREEPSASAVQKVIENALRAAGLLR